MTTINGNNTGSTEINTVTKTTYSGTLEQSAVYGGSTTTSTNAWTVSETSTMYMRAKTITFTARGLKPNTQYYPFFNGVFVGVYCSTVNEQQQSDIISNAQGDIVGNFYMPGSTFTAGTHKFELVDHTTLDSNNTITADPIYGSAEAAYESTGVLKQQQTQVTSPVIKQPVSLELNNTSVSTTQTNPQPINVVPTPNVTTTTSNSNIASPAPDMCEEWHFVFERKSTDTKKLSITTSNTDRPSLSSINFPTGTVTASIQYSGIKPANNGKYAHEYEFAVATVSQHTVTWIGKANSNRADVASFRPSGIALNDTITIITPWTKVRDTVCPVKLGTQVTTKVDPLAQSFFVDPIAYPSGMFATSVDIFFKTVDKSTPVMLELRMMSNGLPGSTILPGGKVLVPGYAVSQSDDASIATTFRFDQPIFLQSNTEYCFVLKSSSLGYNAWCSRVGETDISTGIVIDAQPFSGTLFKSENDSTWVPDSYEDIKFGLNIAQFNTGTTSELVFKPQLDLWTNNYYATSQTLPLSYLSTIRDTKTIVAKIPMHGLKASDKIFINGIDAAAGMYYNNIAASSLIGEFTVSSVIDEDIIQFTLASSANNANKTGYIVAQDSYGFINTTPPVSGSLASYVETPTVLNTTELVPSTYPSKIDLPDAPTPPVVTSPGTFTVYTNLIAHEVMVDYLGTTLPTTTISEKLAMATTNYGTPIYTDVPSDGTFFTLEEPLMLASPRNENIHNLSTTKSLRVKMQMTSSNKDVTPIIDTNAMSMIVKSYKIDNQSDEIESLVTEEDFNDATKNSEILPGQGRAAAKYKSAVNRLADYYNQITIFVVGNCPEPAYIDVYTRTSTDEYTHIDRNWKWVPVNGVQGTAFNRSADSSVTNEWMFVYTPTDLNEYFNVFDVKLVMRTTTNSIVPKIYGVRAIMNKV